MARKSSKTAHVMNLLAGEEAESPKEEAARENLAARQTSDSTEKIRELTDSNQPPSPPTPISIIDMSSSAPDPVAELIREQLEEAEETEDMKDVENIEDMRETEHAPGPEAPALAQEAEPKIPEPVVPPFQYLNVMEHIIKNAAPEYMDKFDVCSCERCTADVTALALSHLPPKYIVAEQATASPLLNFYTTRFSQQVVVELTKACSMVKENPHH